MSRYYIVYYTFALPKSEPIKDQKVVIEKSMNFVILLKVVILK